MTPPRPADTFAAAMDRHAQGPVITTLACLGLLSGCASPWSRGVDADLRRSVAETASRELVEARATPAPVPTPEPGPDPLGFSDDRLRELDDISGLSSFGAVEPPLGPDLLGRETRTALVSLQQAVVRAVRHNLSAQIARLDSAATQADIVAAQAFFDWTFFADTTFQITDQPSVVPIIGSVPIGTGFNRSKSYTFDAGLRRQLTTGGRFQVQQTLNIFNNQSPGRRLSPDPARTATLDITVDQPLLRGFGSDVALAQVRLARNLDRAQLESLRDQLITVVTETERGYWRLARARRDAQIQSRLLERGVATRDVLRERLSFDVRPAEYSDAVAQVETRRANLIRAVNEVRLASDDLKALLNDPGLPVGGEVVLLAADDPLGEPIEVSLLDSIETALARRPDIQRAILTIDDAAIRETIADNARLPRLDLRLATRLSGLDNTTSGSFSRMGDGNFVDWLAGLQFERPLGNRSARAGFRRARLERLRSVVAYRAAVQASVVEIKRALRAIDTNRRLIEQTRIARLAAAENLRALLVEEDNIRGLTPEFLNLKFQRQQGLATAESAEIGAQTDYASAIADLSRAIGTSLERNGIALSVEETAAPAASDDDPAGE